MIKKKLYSGELPQTARQIEGGSRCKYDNDHLKKLIIKCKNIIYSWKRSKSAFPPTYVINADERYRAYTYMLKGVNPPSLIN